MAPWMPKYTCQSIGGACTTGSSLPGPSRCRVNLTILFVFQGPDGLRSESSANTRMGSCDLGSSSPMWHAQASEKSTPTSRYRGCSHSVNGFRVPRSTIPISQLWGCQRPQKHPLTYKKRSGIGCGKGSKGFSERRHNAKRLE